MSQERFLAAVREAAADGSLRKLVLAAPTGEGVRKVEVRPVVLARGPTWQVVERRPGGDRTSHEDDDALLRRVSEALGTAFRSGHLYTDERSLQLEWRKGTARLSSGPPAEVASSGAHDRARQRAASLDPRWLTALGVLDERGKVRRGMEAKHRQIHRFVEVLHHHLAGLTPRREGEPVLVDIGCGKGLLTFAAWEALRSLGFPHPRVIGVELRPELAAKVEAVARELGCEGLSFVGGTADTLEVAPDVVIALHACDTATDEALALAVSRGAQVIVAAPCCHKQLRPQLAAPAALGPVLRHGILKTREADLVTDALRAALLEAVGFEARVFEFVSTEHTDRNLMIAATRRSAPRPGAEEEARALAAFYGVEEQELATRLGVPLIART
ncbi:MAG: SAM-dependent methyltransferase [Alphaproteobacteria bacterium]|nr:SAM-dependent methyltransferase [Alphaproteobacteria bacterium]MCB9699261.1 SAM-dependent methyltransferase [Alphaproteobacteria bacterium]